MSLAMAALDSQLDIIRWLKKPQALDFMQSFAEDQGFDQPDVTGQHIWSGALHASHWATTYSVSSEIGEVLEQAAPLLPSFVVEAHDVPSEAGFIWLEEGLPVTDRRGETLIYKAFLWAQVELVLWSHRWLVKGHWRKQWYPSIQDHRPRWIPQHIKGPDNLPLIVKDEIFVVDR